jgi:hypothetical protein
LLQKLAKKGKRVKLLDDTTTNRDRTNQHQDHPQKEGDEWNVDVQDQEEIQVDEQVSAHKLKEQEEKARQLLEQQ